MTQIKTKTRKPKTKRMYFGPEVDVSITKYNNTEDRFEKSMIYQKEIKAAFDKLAENIIHTFKFYYTEVDEIEHLQHEVITFLLSKIHLFDPSKGAKAYSYFGTIAKRYLIISNQKNYKKRVDKAPFEILEESEEHSYNIEDHTYSDPLSDYINQYVEHCTNNIYKLFPKGDDAAVADAILELFRKRENLDIFNKKALYIYIREIIDVKTPKITKIANRLYDIFKEGYVFYLEHGYTNF